MSTSTHGGAQQGANAQEGGGMKEKAQEATAQAREVGEQATQAAAQAGSHVSQSAKAGAQEVAHEARQQGMQLAQEATQQFQTVAQEASTQLREQASSQTERAAQQLRSLSDQARAFAEGRTEEAGQLPAYAQQATEKLSDFAQRLETGGIDGVMSDARQFARRRPGTFLLACGIAGFAAGRMLRGAKAVQGDTSTDVTTSAQTPGQMSIDLTTQERALSEVGMR
jgi:hypothetical protein